MATWHLFKIMCYVLNIYAFTGMSDLINHNYATPKRYVYLKGHVPSFTNYYLLQIKLFKFVEDPYIEVC